MIETFVTSEGVEIKIRPVARKKLALILSSRRIPKVPTYTVKTASGGEQEFEHDETTIETVEEKAMWGVYLAEVAKEEAEFTSRWLTLVLMDGTLFDLPKSDDWLKAQEFQGIPHPLKDEVNELRLHYLMTEILRHEPDVARLIDAIMALNKVQTKAKQEAVEAVVDNFQPEAQGQANQDAPVEGKLDH
jgi:hypothetical protein